MNWFNVLPELLDEEVVVSTEIKSGWWNVWETYYDTISVHNCDQCTSPIHYSVGDFLDDFLDDLLLQDLHYLLIWCIVFSSLVYLVIFGIYYIIFRCKKVQNPFKYAFEKSRLWLITILAVLIIAVIVLIFVRFSEF